MTLKIVPGRFDPLGATSDSDGTNFAVAGVRGFSRPRKTIEPPPSVLPGLPYRLAASWISRRYTRSERRRFRHRMASW